jgi:predicted nuclease of predicted toxin-antitoxin system
MNLSPDWVAWLTNHGWETVHWTNIGDPRATDQSIMAWAAVNNYVVFTHDLDFGTTLALTRASRPSVFQIRVQDPLPDSVGEIVLATLREHDKELQSGALVVLDYRRSRVRVLPI